MQRRDWDWRLQKRLRRQAQQWLWLIGNEEAVEAATRELLGEGYRALAIKCDVSDDAQVEAMVKRTVSAFGRLDAAYNNLGIQNVLAETADSPRDYDRVMAVNLRGVWSCMKFELQVMREQGSGAIVNCSSLGGLLGGNQRGTYHAAKHGVIRLHQERSLGICHTRHPCERRVSWHDPEPNV